MNELKAVNIFVASSGELMGERNELILIVNSIGKLHKHLKLEVIRWETDLEAGSYQKQRVQDEINPFLKDSDIVIVLVYSKLGKFTLEEYNLAIETEKKVFLYFKQGFSPKTLEEIKVYQEVLEFRGRLEKENRTLYKDYETTVQLENILRNDLPFYLKKVFPPVVGVPKYLTDMPAKTVELIGRERELKDMARLLEYSDLVLLVNGLGGVGKTELCKRYFKDNCDDFRHLAWVDVVGDIRESFVNAFRLDVIGCRNKDTMDERFDKIMGFLRSLDKNCLLVVDNIENDRDDDLDKILRFPFKVVVSSRLQLKGFKRYDLDFLSGAACKKLFYNFYKGKRDDESLDRIIELAGSHTLTVELLARTAQNSAVPLDVFLKTLANTGFNLNDAIPEKVASLWDRHGVREKFFNHLLKIFALSNVTDEELHILANLSVLPSIYISISDVSEWLELENKEAVNSLVFKGWLKREEGRFNIFMHKVIREVILYKATPDVEKCKNLIVSLKWKLYLNPGENPIDKKRYLIFAETLLQHIDENDEDLATFSNNLSRIYIDLGQTEKALEFQLKTFKILEQVLDKNHPDLAASYNNLALIYKDLGQTERALEFQSKALYISEEVLDRNHPDLAASYNSVSLIYEDLGQTKKALEFQLKSLKILEQVLNKDHPVLATSYNNLAVIYNALGHLEKALEFQVKALNIREQVLDKNHPDLAVSYNNLAEIYRVLGQPEKALEFQVKALNMIEQVLDKNHPILATSYNNLSVIYQDLDQPEKALEFQSKALNIRERVLDKNHPVLATSYNNIAEIYRVLGQTERALEFQLKSLNIIEQVLDKNHPDLASSYKSLALIYLDLKDYESAVNYGGKAVAILQQLFPNGHPDLDMMKHDLEWIKSRSM